MTRPTETQADGAGIITAINAGIDSYIRSSGVAMHPGVRREIVAHIQASIRVAFKKWQASATVPANAWWRES